MKKYQIYITDSGRHGKMNRFSFSSFHLRLLAGVFVFVLVSLGVLAVDYSVSVSRQAELRRLRVENQHLTVHIQRISEKIQGLEANLQKIEDFSFKLKYITKGRSPVHKAIGPLPSHYNHYNSLSVPAVDVSTPAKKKFQQKNLEPVQDDSSAFMQIQKVDSLTLNSSILFREIWDTLGVLEENKHLLRVTPSIWPAKGWVTSRFGYRDYPLSQNDGFSLGSLVDFHGGLDIAAAIGTDIVSPADGVVAETGSDARTGNYIIVSHGYGLKTLYGHLDQILVRSSQAVKRGELIGTIGNTGRSTGAHLHYEVRIDGQPVNPEYYILN